MRARSHFPPCYFRSREVGPQVLIPAPLGKGALRARSHFPPCYFRSSVGPGAGRRFGWTCLVYQPSQRQPAPAPAHVLSMVVFGQRGGEGAWACVGAPAPGKAAKAFAPRASGKRTVAPAPKPESQSCPAAKQPVRKGLEQVGQSLPSGCTSPPPSGNRLAGMGHGCQSGRVSRSAGAGRAGVTHCRVAIWPCSAGVRAFQGLA